MTPPLKLSFDVACSPEHAFETWTGKATAWWPKEHTASHQPGAKIVFEPRAGGRIYERTLDGDEIDWGEIVEWEPPRRLRYRWHIATELQNATDVEIVFNPVSGDRTRVEIEHGGWDRLGELGQRWREVNRGGWRGVVPAYMAAARS
ncbi:MAG TPA: SRPBCC domain-containing protein [Candidatus Dormibacteraeota bacterium]|nr:SRPBCC domain-containing protein [Candidatus Dormibacteraeota bacterium]